MLTDRQAVRLVGRLPGRVRQRLALGPVVGDHEPGECCRVCMATERVRAMLDGPCPSTSDSWTRRRLRQLVAVSDLHAWHQGVDIADRMDALADRGFWTPPFVLGEGDECYRRCVVIYAAAGWRPVAGERAKPSLRRW